MVKTKRQKTVPQVGQGWQPEVAQFLLDMFPTALDSGMGLSDLYKLATLTSSDDVIDALDSLDLLPDDDDDDFEDDENI